MNKVKKAVNELRNYLGRDARGVKLLENISKIVNNVHKEFSVAQEDARSTRELLEEANESRRLVDLKVQKLEDELTHERALRQQRDRDVAAAAVTATALQRRLDELVPELPVPEMDTEAKPRPPHLVGELPDALKDMKALTEAFNRLRKDMPVAPAPTPIGKTLEQRGVVYMYYLHDLVRNYSPSSMMTLGRFVVSLSVFGIPAVINTDHPAMHWRTKEGLQFSDKSLETFVRWFRHGIKASKLEDMIYGGHPGHLVQDHAPSKGPGHRRSPKDGA